jgi:hypothetical protein
MPELQDDQTLESYGIVDGNVLYLSDKEAVILFVKMLTGKTLEISISLKAPVLSLKEEIQTKEGIPPGMVQFILPCIIVLTGVVFSPPTLYIWWQTIGRSLATLIL